MSKNKLKLKDDKTELLSVLSKNAQNKTQKNIQIVSSTSSASTNVQNLGIHLDSTLSMENHIKDMPIRLLPNQESKQHKKTPF